MKEREQELSIEDLAERVGVSVRTIRYYIAEGLLPGPEGRGKAAAYGAQHLLRLRLIRRLAERHVPLAEIAQRLSALGERDVEALLREEDRRATELERAAQAPSPREYVSALLRRARAARPAALRETHEPALALRSSPAAFEAPRPAQAWRRWELAPGVELHVRADVGERERVLVAGLLRLAGVSAEDQDS